MGLEIERKFLVKSDAWKPLVSRSIDIKQGYLSSKPERTVRVRIADDKGLLTIKGKSENLTRKEFEYEIPLPEAQELILLCERSIIEKTRHVCQMDQVIWEIDVFRGENQGLVLAEVELISEDQIVSLPSWIGQEVSADPRYYNSALQAHPYGSW